MYLKDGRGDFAAIACITWNAGLRIHERFRTDTTIAEQVLRESAITIKGKGGKIRTVPINDSIRAELETLLAVTPRGHKLVVPDDVPPIMPLPSSSSTFTRCARRSGMKSLNGL